MERRFPCVDMKAIRHIPEKLWKHMDFSNDEWMRRVWRKNTGDIIVDS